MDNIDLAAADRNGVYVSITAGANATFNVLVAALFGLLGVVFRILGCNPAPLVLAVVLEPLLEQNFRRPMIVSAGDLTIVVTRPISLSVLVLTAMLAMFFSARSGCSSLSKLEPRP